MYYYWLNEYHHGHPYMYAYTCMHVMLCIYVGKDQCVRYNMYTNTAMPIRLVFTSGKYIFCTCTYACTCTLDIDTKCAYVPIDIYLC